MRLFFDEMCMVGLPPPCYIVSNQHVICVHCKSFLYRKEILQHVKGFPKLGEPW